VELLLSNRTYWQQNQSFFMIKIDVNMKFSLSTIEIWQLSLIPQTMDWNIRKMKFWVKIKNLKLKGLESYHMKSMRIKVNILCQLWNCHPFSLLLSLWLIYFILALFLTNQEQLATNLLIKESIQREKKSLMTKIKEKKTIDKQSGNMHVKNNNWGVEEQGFFFSNDSQSNEVVTPYHLKWFHDSWHAFMSKI